jgi:O-succinylbenzoic acid--CoA ligase
VAELLALDLPGGPEFVRAVLDAWDSGAAVAPVDRRLAPVARKRELEALAPTSILTPTGKVPYPGRPVEEGDALVIATSGSSGEPRGVVLTHHAVAASAHATSQRLEVDPRRHRWLACLPLNHIGGFSVVSRALCTGTPLEVHAGFDAARVMEAAGATTLVSLVPTALSRIDAADFYRVLLGGSAPPPDLPRNVVTTYGMTETGSGVVYDGQPLDGVEVAITAASEIVVRGPMLLRAYRDGATPLQAGGWLRTGDRGHCDGDGRLHVEGRLSDMIVTGGENVWPLAVERVLVQHPGVAEVAVSSRPDAQWGERIVACVVPAELSAPPSLPELRDLVKDQIAAFAAPRELVLMADLPKTSLGKIRRDDLRRRLTETAEGPAG